LLDGFPRESQSWSIDECNFYFNIFLSLLRESCSSLTLEPCDFSWPVKSSLSVDGQGNVQSERYYVSINVKELLFAETQDSVNVSKVILRVIRDINGYYFITASHLKNVYVFEQKEGGLKLKNKILVSQNGLSESALNPRVPFI
jgi:hypothetical protein